MDAEAPQKADRDDELRQLVLAAFDRARDSGKSDWQEMTLAVLKNRLLQLTNHEFRMERYALKTMPQLASSLSDLITLHPGPPPFVKLTNPDTEMPVRPGNSFQLDLSLPALTKSGVSAPSDWKLVRVRDDLWRAMMDYSGTSIYVLDPETGLARPKEITDDPSPELPTVTSATVKEWRREFAQRLKPSLAIPQAKDLDTWVDGDGRTNDLPRSHRGRWSEFIKRNVSSTLGAWFETHSIPVPQDLLVLAAGRGTARSEVIEEVVETRRLRSTLIRALSLMTHEEMAVLPIPASVVVRLGEQSNGARN